MNIYDPPRLSVTFAAGDVFDDDGVAASAATSAAPVTVLPASMTGAAMVGTTGRFSKLPRSVVISRSNSPGSYTVQPIVITGVRGSKTIVETLTPANANGNDALRSVAIFDSVVSVAFPAQVNGAGAFRIGVQDIGVPQPGDRFAALELAAAGNLNVRYGDAPDAQSDSIPVAAALVGQQKWIAPTRVLTDPTLAAPTTVGLTAYVA